MSILIKGMEMPKSYKDIRIYGDGRIVSKSLHTYGEEIATAVPVPPHGKCIDVDALIRELEITEEDDRNGATLLMAVFLEVLKSAPTIIPAEEETE